MAIQISGTTVIDNSRNLTNIGSINSSSVSTTTVTATTVDADKYAIQNLPTLTIMAIQSGDTILVQRGSTSYKTNALTYSDTAQASDLLLVNRGSNSYKMRYDAVDNANSSDIVLVNRGSTSYKATMEQLRDVLGQPITFTVQLGGPGFSGTDSGCSNTNRKYCYGATISASVTAKTTDIYSFAGDGTTLFINGDWIVTAGHAGNVGVSYTFGCNAIIVGANGLGLSGVGNKTLEGQKPNEYISYSPYYQQLNGGGGAGAPGGATGAKRRRWRWWILSN